MNRTLLPFLCLLTLPWGCGPSEPSDAKRPHVLVILADDLGFGDVGFLGGEALTPHLDQLAAESMVLERFYAAPMCSPARAQILTGRHALSLGMTRNVKPQDPNGLPLDVPTIAGQLRSNGYATALVGKWHLGHDERPQEPRSRGFNEFYGHLRGWIDYWDHSVMGIPDWHRNGKLVVEEGYATDLIAAEACRTLEAHDQRQPLFLMVSFNAPHTPLQAPDGEPKGSSARDVYCAMVRRLDQRIGDVLTALDKSGMAEDCVLWFLSDNGANPKYGGSNAPLKGGKYSCAEGGLRVPACVRFPGRISPGTSAEFLGTVDIAPTLAGLAALEPLVGIEGIDARGVLFGEKPAPSRNMVFAVDHARVQRRAILRAPFKLIEERRGEELTYRLFDVSSDPLEERELSTENPEAFADLMARVPWK